MSAQLLGNVTDLGEPACLQPSNVIQHDAAQLGLGNMLEPGLEALDVLLDLLKEGELLGELHQARIRRAPHFFERGRTGSNQRCIQCVVLGAAQP